MLDILYHFRCTRVFQMHNKIIISPTNKKAIAILKDLQEKKAKLRNHFAKKGKPGSLKEMNT
jgi:hypothetical protein